MPNINLPTDLLRTFVSIVDLGGYTKAAEVLGRTQPAISLQMGRLQDLLGCKLFESSGRKVTLTEQGETLVVFARQILRLNDEAVAKFTDPAAHGILRLGLPTDFAVEFLQGALNGFADAHENVELEVQCDLSRRLLDLLNNDELDVAIALLPAGDNQYLAQAWEERPIWAASKTGTAHRKKPVPIVSHPQGCEYRNRIIAALGKARRSWRFA
ncbi:MAG: LysR family transcriptional regulator, partial [Aestuariivirgaceae bacterium]